MAHYLTDLSVSSATLLPAIVPDMMAHCKPGKLVCSPQTVIPGEYDAGLLYGFKVGGD